jgi:AraC-like DNA-binding protein
VCEFPPTGRLQPYVRAFEVLSTTEASAHACVLDFADTDVSMPLIFGDPISIHGPTPEVVASGALVGPRTRPVWLRFDGTIDQINVAFLPGRAGAFTSLSLPELADRLAAPDEAWPADFRQAVADLEPLPVHERLARLEQLLLARLEPRLEPSPQIREAIRLIQATSGRVRVRSVADHANLSVSQLERSFNRHLGVGPKLFARVTRASQLAARFGAGGRSDWARLAPSYGYSDQAHLARDFHELLGLTPSALTATGMDADFLQDAIAYRGRLASVSCWRCRVLTSR